MRDDPTGPILAVVENERRYCGGTRYQGPLVNLIQTEVVAEQFDPETFGAWNGLEALSNADEQLFDHERVADVVTGDSYRSRGPSESPD